MTLTYRNGISIAEIVVYIPSLFIALFLCIRHGFGKSAGFYFLIVFCLARIIGPCMQLATINAPTNVSLYTGAAILQSVGLSPLELASLGLLSRLITNIQKSHNTFIKVRMIKFIELIITVGLILGIVGGINASSNLSTTGKYTPGSLSHASIALFIVSWVGIFIAVILVSFHASHADHGEKRLLVAVAIALPFFLVRLVYSVFSTFTHVKAFNLTTGSPTVLLCVALIEEFIVVVVFLSIGLTLNKLEKTPIAEGARMIPSQDSQYRPGDESASGPDTQKAPVKENAALRMAKRTIVGRIVMSFSGDKENTDVEMQGRRQRRH